jgi:queuine tRNA-ribosyltransferase
MHWQGPILTDSGGFQVFSLGDMRKISEAGVDFRSPKDGAKIFMGPEESIKIQSDLGADIVMIFDECTPYPADKVTAEQSMQLSLRWAQRSKDTHQALGNENALFAIKILAPSLGERKSTPASLILRISPKLNT